ncbi:MULTISPECIES: lasso RiPP family leader peptide-containing protein [unclassified Crossiella]|nr:MULTISPECIES: lasso RiPP family leader peptide-containing protein [unclassified Crossiella]MCK2258851.1 lasso RiPP family leader peptide-containing protein [Crossiella sp. S99.1]
MEATTFPTDAIKEAPRYEPPEVIALGGVVELTQGSAFDDTMEKRSYYF